MKLQELFESEQKQKLNEENKDQWDFKVNEHGDYIGVNGNVGLGVRDSFFEYYMEARDKLKEKGLSEEQFKQAHEELRDALDNAREEANNLSVEEDVQKLSETMYAMMKSLLVEASQKKTQIFHNHMNEVLKRYDS